MGSCQWGVASAVKVASSASNSRYIAFKSDQSSAWSGVLPSGCSAICRATVTARCVRRTSPNSHPPKFSSAHSPTSNVRALTARLHPAGPLLVRQPPAIDVRPSTLLEDRPNLLCNPRASPRQEPTQHTQTQVTKQVRPNRHRCPAHRCPALANFVKMWVSSSFQHAGPPRHLSGDRGHPARKPMCVATKQCLCYLG